MPPVKPKVIVITGPTAVGKSALALELAQEMDGEIINADSQQVYREMNIGTAKPSREEREKIRHHLIDLVYPDEEFNVAMFRQAAVEAVSDIRARKKQAIVCGGTGLYIKVVTAGLFVGPPENVELRKQIRARIEENGLGPLYERLQQVDPAAVAWIHPHDRHRIIRALEVYELTGKPISQWQKEHRFSERAFETFAAVLDRERSELYHRINDRCERMIHDGLVEEVRNLRDKGYDLGLRALQGVGYRHVGLYLAGALSFKEALGRMKRDTRHLAKRQLTWFRGAGEVRWFHPEENREDIKQAVKNFLTL